MLALYIFLLLLGFVLLIKGADWFVDGCAGIAERCKIPPLVVGLTVVAFGTSAPELAVSIASAVKDSTELAIGNVVGSNIANILLILGVASLVCALPVKKNSFKLDFPALLISGGLLILLGSFGYAVNWWDGLILFSVYILYVVLLLLDAMRERKKTMLEVPKIEPESEKKIPKTAIGRWYGRMKEKIWFLIILTLVGIGMIVGGGTLLVDSAKYIAQRLGISEGIIGLTVVAIGTSLPELVTSVVAAAKKQTDIAVGNVIGSNIFNVLVVAGLSSLFCPLPFSLTENLIDASVALGCALLLFVLALFPKRRIGRVGGVILLLCFIGYYSYLFAMRI